MRTASLVALGLLGSMALIPQAFGQAAGGLEDGHVTVGNTPSYFQGDFGTGSTVDIFDDSTYAQFKNRDVRIKLVVPYLAVSGLPNGAQLSGGAVVSRNNGAGNSGHGHSGATGLSETTGSHSASGIGDVQLSLHYTVYHGEGLTPSIVPYTRVTFGTASASQGLGTGKNDYEFGIGIHDVVDARLFPFAHLGYRIVGNPSGDNLQNVVTYDLGASYALNPHNVLTAFFSGAQSEQPGYAGPADLIFAYNYNVTASGSGFQVFFDKGLTNGSPDFGIGIGAQIVF